MMRFKFGAFGGGGRGHVNFGQDCDNNDFTGKNPFSFGHGAGSKGFFNAGHGQPHGFSLFGHKDDDHHHDDDSHHQDHHEDHHDHHGDNHGQESGDDCADDGDTGTGSGGGIPFPGVPTDTTGVTLHVDLNGDGLDDLNIWIETPAGVDPSTLDLSDYYTKAAEELKTLHPEADPKTTVIKATIYSASQGESYYYFTGDETTDLPTDDQDDSCDTSDHDGHDHKGHDHDHDHDDDHHDDSHDGEDKDDEDEDKGESDCDDSHDDDHESKPHDGEDDHEGGDDCGDFFKQFVANFGCIDDKDEEEDEGDHEDEDDSSHEKACWI